MSDYITQSTLLDMGWTKRMIEVLLPEPVLKPNPHYRSGSPMKLYDKAHAVEVMDGQEFAEMLAVAEKRRESARKGIETQKSNLLNQMEKLTAMITIPRIENIQDIAFQRKYDIASARDGFDGYFDPSESDVIRWAVNYIRHELVNYDDLCYMIRGKIGSSVAYSHIKNAILMKIAETYPELSDECKRQEV